MEADVIIKALQIKTNLKKTNVMHNKYDNVVYSDYCLILKLNLIVVVTNRRKMALEMKWDPIFQVIANIIFDGVWYENDEITLTDN